MKQRFFSFTAALLILGILCSCSINTGKTKYTTYSMDYFDTVITISGYENSKEDFDKVSREMLEMFGEYHRLYSIYDTFDGIENLCTINGAHRTVTVDRRIIDLLVYSKRMYDVTGGIVNIAMGSVLSLWHDYRTAGNDDPDNASLPPMDLLRSAAEHTDISMLIIDEQNCTVTLTDPLMSLDVGAIAKGYATECVAQAFEQKGVTGYVMSVGGNVRTIGTKPDGDKWTVGIENPNGEEYLAYLKLDDQSLVTSGSYQRFYYVDGKQYHHIISPDTLMPATEYLSVSVVCKDSGLADTLSTALFCLPYNQGLELISKLTEVEAMWVTNDGQKLYSQGFNKYEKEDN